MIFSGQPRRSRQINLGNRQQLNREDALKKAERERQERQDVRQRVEAARRLVAAWRRRRSRLKSQRELRDRYAASNGQISSPAGIELDYAFFLPRLFERPDNEVEALLRILVSNQTRFSPTLLESFEVIWKHKPRNSVILDLAGRSLMAHPPASATVAFSQFAPLIELLIDSEPLPRSIENLLHLVIVQHPAKVVGELLCRPALVAHFTDTMLQPLINLKALPPLDPATVNAWPLAVRLLEDPHNAFPLLALILDQVPSGSVDLETEAKLTQLCNHEFVSSIVAHLEPYALAKLFLKLIDLFPDIKSELLLHLTLSATPSPVHALWQEFRKSDLYRNLINAPKQSYPNSSAWQLLQLVLEMYSYWLIVVMDVDMFDDVRGFSRESVGELSVVVRNAAFSVLWNDSIVPFRPILMTTLRQLYTKDTRRQFTPDNFWIMESHIDTVLSATQAQNLDSIYFDTPAGVSSPLERIFQHAPFFVRFRMRAERFMRFTQRDRSLNGTPPGFPNPENQENLIRREHLCEDAQFLFARLGPNLRNLRVMLMSNGVREAGIDGGGLTKEVLIAICAEMFRNPPSPPPFVTNDSHLLFPNPVNSIPGEHAAEALAQYRFLGQTVGKCLYEGVLIDVEFARFFLQKWAGDAAVKSSFDDLYYLDPAFYSSLVAVYNYDGNVEDLGLDFTTVSSVGTTVNLKPNGSDIAVTNANRLEYIHAVANYRLNTSLAPQTRAFLSGMSDLIPLHWLRMFNPHEIQTLISGGTSSIDVDDLERNSIVNGFASGSKTVTNFWKVVREMTSEQQHKLLQFVTSAPKGPLLGFGTLEPKFCIRCSTQAPNQSSALFPELRRESASRELIYDDGRLPTASTCVNLLKLPEYSSLETLRQKLLLAIEANAGFDLS